VGVAKKCGKQEISRTARQRKWRRLVNPWLSATYVALVFDDTSQEQFLFSALQHPKNF